jgi:hypothetical protein
LSKVTEHFKPQTFDWPKLFMTVMIAALMLLVGRVWGESRIEETVTLNQRQTSLNKAAVGALGQRLDDHFSVEAERYQTILNQLAEIRRNQTGMPTR